MNTTTTKFDRFANDERWLGYGYLGEHRNALLDTDPEVPAIPETVAIVDALILGAASELGWTDEDLFTWANSKVGRWMGDVMLHGNVARLPEDWAQQGRRLMRLPR